jgi:hypothetical protein
MVDSPVSSSITTLSWPPEFPPIKPKFNKRSIARARILSAANSNRGPGTGLRTFRMKHIQEAVHKARKFRLVANDVLKEAGFNGS